MQIQVNIKNQNFNKHEILSFFSLFWAVDFVKDTQAEKFCCQVATKLADHYKLVKL